MGTSIIKFFSHWPFSPWRIKHAQKGNRHTVSVENLRVIVFDEARDVWIAQCIDIDYVASGETAEKAKQNFERGLLMSIKLNLEKFGHLNNFLKPPPLEWMAQIGRYNQSNHDINISTTHDVLTNTSIHQITFYEPKAA